MSKRQSTKFQAAFERYGYTIPEDGVQSTALGRERITKIVAPDGRIITNPAELVDARKTSPEVRSAMKRVFNPLYYGLADKVATSFLEKNGTNKQKKITATDEEEQRKQLAEATSGERAGGSRNVVLIGEGGEEYVIDEDGNRVSSADPGFEAAKQAAEQRLADLESKADGGKAVSKMLRVGGIGAVSALGIADSACTVYNLGRAVAAAAKVARAQQLIQFAMVLNTAADSMKAGDATPEEARFVGDMITATDTRKTIIDEVTGEEIDNPFYGKSGFDAPGYKTASYNDAPVLTAESQQYMIGGGFSGTLSGVLDNIASSLGVSSAAGVRETCGVIQNPWVRGVGLAAGILLAIGSFGVGQAVIAAGSIALTSIAVPLLEAFLMDMATQQVIGEDIKGVPAGDAGFAGNAALLGGIAQNRGMTPQSAEGIENYSFATLDTREELIADERRSTENDQWNVYNQYSFIGSFVRTLYPASVQAKSGAAGAIRSVGTILNQGLTSITQSVSATQTFNPARFEQCKDPGYEELGIDADVFCNVRYGLTSAELAMDSEKVVDFMVEGKFISNTGTPQGTYAEFMKECANRTEGWGETGEEGNPDSTGVRCIDGTGKTFDHISYFRVFTMDYSISEAMDDEQDATSQPSGTGEYVLPTDPGYGISSQWGPRSCSGCSTYHKALDISNFPGGSSGKAVYSIGDGEVITATRGNGSGNSCTSGMGNAPYGANNPVHIRHPNGVISVYLHMPPGSITVNVGDQVTAGQQIGVIGNCGQSFGAHLHFETMVDDATEAQFRDIGGGDAYGPWRNPGVVMPLLGVDIINGSYTDGR